MSFVIRRKSDGKYAYGRQRYSTDWVDLQKARVYPTRGNATSSLRQLFNRPRRYHNEKQPLGEDAFEIVEIHLTEYLNTPTVVCVLVPLQDNTKVLAVRRVNQPAQGKLGLPGGYQMKNETWQQAGCREVLEETGFIIKPEWLHLESLCTDEYGNNLLIASVWPTPETYLTTNCRDGEASELVIASGDEDDWGFPRHQHAVCEYLA